MGTSGLMVVLPRASADSNAGPSCSRHVGHTIERDRVGVAAIARAGRALALDAQRHGALVGCDDDPGQHAVGIDEAHRLDDSAVPEEGRGHVVGESRSSRGRSSRATAVDRGRRREVGRSCRRPCRQRSRPPCGACRLRSQVRRPVGRPWRNGVSCGVVSPPLPSTSPVLTSPSGIVTSLSPPSASSEHAGRDTPSDETSVATNQTGG